MPKILTDPKFWTAVITALFMVGNEFLDWGVSIEAAVTVLVPAIVLILALAWQQVRQIDEGAAFYEGYRKGIMMARGRQESQHNKSVDA